MNRLERIRTRLKLADKYKKDAHISQKTKDYESFTIEVTQNNIILRTLEIGKERTTMTLDKKQMEFLRENLNILFAVEEMKNEN